VVSDWVTGKTEFPGYAAQLWIQAKAVGIVESTLVFGEPAWQGAVMENGPDIDTGVSSGLQDLRDVINSIDVPVAGAGLES
jgi:hypothetical protein